MTTSECKTDKQINKARTVHMINYIKIRAWRVNYESINNVCSIFNVRKRCAFILLDQTTLRSWTFSSSFFSLFLCDFLKSFFSIMTCSASTFICWKKYEKRVNIVQVIADSAIWFKVFETYYNTVIKIPRFVIRET